MVDTYKPHENKPVQDNSENNQGFFYEKGENKKFKEFLDLIVCEEIKGIVKYARKYLPENEIIINKSIFKRLENIIERYQNGHLEINKEDWMDWEMLGRPYFHIFRFFYNTNDENNKKIRDICWERAIVSYLKALQGNEAIKVYNMCPPDAPYLKDRFEETINKVTSRISKTEIMERIKEEEKQNKTDIPGIEKKGENHYTS